MVSHHEIIQLTFTTMCRVKRFQVLVARDTIVETNLEIISQFISQCIGNYVY